MRRRCGLVLVLASFAVAPPVFAQSRFEIGGGVTWTGGFDAGGLDALETRPGAGSTPLTLFATDSRVTAAAGVRAHAAWFLTPRLAIEGAGEYSRPALETTISNDFERATGSVAEIDVASYVFGGSVLLHFGARRLVPFVFVGAGYLRQLDGDGTGAVTGAEFHGGGGVKYALSSRVGLRVDGGISSRDTSMAFDVKRRTLPVIGASVAYRF